MVDGGPRHVGLGHLVNIHGGSGHLEHIWDRAVTSDHIMGHRTHTWCRAGDCVGLGPASSSPRLPLDCALPLHLLHVLVNVEADDGKH